MITARSYFVWYLLLMRFYQSVVELNSTNIVERSQDDKNEKNIIAYKYKRKISKAVFLNSKRIQKSVWKDMIMY